MAEGEVSCGCRICHPGDPPPEDQQGRQFLATVREWGWAVVPIDEEPDTPPWAFTVGLWHTLHMPELIVFGRPSEKWGQVLNEVGYAARQGRSPRDGEVFQVAADLPPLAAKAVDISRYGEVLGFAIWFYQHTGFPALQLFWPDEGGRYPWQEGCDDVCLEAQPDLSRRAGQAGEIASAIEEPWTWPVPADTIAILTKGVAEGGLIVDVWHQTDGRWVFMDEGEPPPGSAAGSHLHELVARHPDLDDLSDLPAGWHAWRESADAPWQREPDRDVEESLES